LVRVGTYEDALSGAVVVEMPRRLRLVRAGGPQALWFLQNTVTADVEAVEDGAWVESTFLTPKGKLLAHMRIGRIGDDLYLDIDTADVSAFVEHLVAQRFRTKVEFEPLDLRAFAVLGPEAATIADAGVALVRDDAVVFGDRFGDVAVAVVHAFERPAWLAFPEGDLATYDVLRVEGGVGAFGVDFGGDDLPQEAGLSRALSVSKGCYVGQETVARIHFRGHINRVVRPIGFDAASADGLVGKTLHLDGQTVGKVTSAVSSPRRGVVGLGMVRVEPREGARLEVDGGGRATVGPIPEGTKVKAD
jgi:folate-binding protein YgfZ